jgi:hypothetical protein
MKPYIIGISILFLIGTYFFITNDKKVINPKKMEYSKAQEYIGSKEMKIDEEQKVDYNEDKVFITKKNTILKQVQVKNQEIQIFDKNLAPLDILDKIFSFNHGDNKDEMTFNKKADLESILIAKLQNESKKETYSMFKKILGLEETTIEDKKYIVDLLEAVGTKESKALLVETYKNSDSDELKEKISALETPEVYILLALEATQNDDIDSYQLMINKLKNSSEEQVINGFMAFTKSDDSDFLDNIKQFTSQWSSNNLSQTSKEITEDYLSRADTQPKERIIAISILANMKNREERDRILTKALEHEDNEDVVNSIQEILNSED